MFISNLSTNTLFSAVRRLKVIIWSRVVKNKGSIKDLSFGFKSIIILFFIFLFFNNSTSSANSSEWLSLIKTKDNLKDDEGILFFEPFSSFPESSDLIITQNNTLHASSPIFIPKAQVLGVELDIPIENVENDIISYRVKKGDSLQSLAKEFGISIDTIIWANDLKKRTLTLDQELIILPVSGVFHIVEEGDSIEALSKKYDVNKEEIISFNNLDQEEIQMGDILILPGGKVPKPVPAPPRPVLRPSLPSSNLIVPTRGHISQGLHWYNAIDIANSCGTPIYAAATGTVQITGFHHIGGNFVRILHSNGIVTYYGHLSRINVSRGQNVSQGDLIGYMGNTGYTIGITGCHLHFEVRGATNPLRFYRVGHRF